MMKFLKSFYLTDRFFHILWSYAALFLISGFIKFLYYPLIVLFLICVLLFFLEIILVYFNRGIEADRNVPEKLSNGDENQITINVVNNYKFQSFLTIFDEIPEIFQIRDFKIHSNINPGESKIYNYNLLPKKRGEYQFGKLNIFVSTKIGFIQRRYIFSNEGTAKVYPSIISMKNYEFKAFSNKITDPGIKKIRKIGHTLEFEQIRNYIQGDDYRSINWKASARKSQLMVNQYEDEKSQPIYSVIDMGRNMKMPFNGMTLLDYSVNSSLILSRIAMLKNDKAGLITFNEEIRTVLPASSNGNQLNLILENLYKQSTGFLEPNYEELFLTIRNKVKQRSLIMLYTNFESVNALKRNSKYLKLISGNHLLIVIFFKNSELFGLINSEADSIQKIYQKVTAEQFAFEKKTIVNELKQLGIISILTSPNELNINVINKYLEIKSRRML